MARAEESKLRWRGYTLWCGKQPLAFVARHYRAFGEASDGWYWAVTGGVLLAHSTALAPVPTIEAAKADCLDYVRSMLAAAQRGGEGER